MAGDAASGTGPDLARGVPAADVLEGVPLLGQVDGEAVLLTRCDGRLRAVGATCPHYGGPLVEGLVADGTIRCPWHHAAFDLATGEAVRPPALAALPCWSVEERDGLAIVTGRREPAERSPTGPATARAGAARRPRTPASVLVLGGGAAGMAAVVTLRQEGYDGPVTMLTAEGGAPVDRPNLSKDYLAGTAPEEWMPLRPAEWFAGHGVELRTGHRATALELTGRRVRLEDGTSLPYDTLLIATGAEPVRLPLGDAARVHYLRTLDDSRAIIRAAEGARTAVVIGSSFIGLEVAASLRARGLAVTVVAPERVPLERVLGTVLGGVVRDLHEANGVRFRLGHTVSAADDHGVVLDDGSRLPADLVVAGVGVRPSVQLASLAGLAVDDGVMVNERLETMAPGVFAAGDIARWPDPHSRTSIRVEHWVVAERQGRTAARNMLGADERFDAVPFFWSAHYDLTVAYVGHARRPERVEIDGDPGARDCTVRYVEGGRVAAVATIGRDDASLRAEAAMERELRHAAGAAGLATAAARRGAPAQGAAP